MDIIANLVYQFLPSSVVHNVWFVLGVALAWALLSEIQPFIKDPRFGWLAKYDGPLQTILGVLGIWKKKSYSVMVLEQAQKAGAGATAPEQLPEIIRGPS